MRPSDPITPPSSPSDPMDERYISPMNRGVEPARPGEFPPVRIGPIELPTPVVLAPMAGITNAPFRRLCRRFGAGLYVSEMITARALVEQNNKTLKLAAFEADETPRSLQIYGVDPEYGVVRGDQVSPRLPLHNDQRQDDDKGEAREPHDRRRLTTANPATLRPRRARVERVSSPRPIKMTAGIRGRREWVGEVMASMYEKTVP